MAKRKQRLLGKSMLTLYDQLGDLIRATVDANRRKELTKQQDDLWDEIARMVEDVLDADDEAYTKAAAAMAAAIAAVQDALKGLKSIVDAVSVAAKAIDLASKVLPV